MAKKLTQDQRLEIFDILASISIIREDDPIVDLGDVETQFEEVLLGKIKYGSINFDKIKKQVEDFENQLKKKMSVEPLAKEHRKAYMELSPLVEMDEELFGDLLTKLNEIHLLITEHMTKDAKKAFEEYRRLFNNQMKKYEIKKKNIKEFHKLKKQFEEFKKKYPDMDTLDLKALLGDFQKEINILKTPNFSLFAKLVNKKKTEAIFDVLPQKIKLFEEKNVLESLIGELKDTQAKLEKEKLHIIEKDKLVDPRDIKKGYKSTFDSNTTNKSKSQIEAYEAKKKVIDEYETLIGKIQKLEEELQKYEEKSHQLDDVRDKIHSLSDQLVEGKITSEAYSEAIKSFKSRKKALKNDLHNIAVQLFKKEDSLDIADHMFTETIKKTPKEEPSDEVDQEHTDTFKKIKNDLDDFLKKISE